MEKFEFSEQYMEQWNNYLYPETNTLKNKLNIKDHDQLAKLDAEMSFEKLYELYENPIKGKFDKEHLKSIHKYIFKDLYNWAGEYRTVFMQKSTSLFSQVETIDLELENDLKMLNEKVLQIKTIYELADFLAEYYICIQHIHPFREGNSRTIREFFRQFVLEKTPLLEIGPMELDLTKMDGNKLSDARLATARLFRGPIVMEFMKALTKRNNKQKVLK